MTHGLCAWIVEEDGGVGKAAELVLSPSVPMTQGIWGVADTVGVGRDCASAIQ